MASFKSKFSILLLFFIIQLVVFPAIQAQSFWKKLGTVTDTMAYNSALLYAKQTQTLFAGTYNKGIMRSENLGNTWEQVLSLPKNQPVFTLFETKSGKILGGGIERIYLSDSLGKKWDEISVPIPMVKRFAQDKNGNLYLCSLDSGGIMQSVNNGETWQKFTTGLPNNYTNNIYCDTAGNLFCTLFNGDGSGNAGLYYYNKNLSKWEKKAIKITLENENYTLKVDFISAITITGDNKFYLSMDAIVTNFAITGIFTNSVEGVINNTLWKMEERSTNANFPFYFRADELYATQKGHLFASRSFALYSLLNYTGNWSVCDAGLDVDYVKGYFDEKEDGVVFFAPEFSNQIYYTLETKPGKKVQTINFPDLPDIKLYDTLYLSATSSSGLEVQFSSRDLNRASVEGNRLRAVGLYEVSIRAHVDGNDSLYYSEVLKKIFINKAANKITIQPVTDFTFTDTTLQITANSTSGEAAGFELLKGNATLNGNILHINGAGPIQIRATETGNGSYEIADTVTFNFCVNPVKPFITADTITGSLVKLKSSATYGNRWFLDEEPLSDTSAIVIPVQKGIYKLKTEVDGCFSLASEPINVTETSVIYFPEINGFAIYPVPFSNSLTIKHKTGNSGFNVTLLNYAGIPVYKAKSDANILVLETETLAPGYYFAKIEYGNKVYFVKVVK